MSERLLTFHCRDDTLVGILHESGEVACDLGVLVVVGGPQYRVGSHRQFVLMARQLALAGFPVLRFDYRGMGDSDGDHRTFDAVEEDIRVAIDTLLGAVPGLRGIVIFGLCDAASAALMYCSCGDRRVAGLVLANPWVRTEAGEANAFVHHYYGRRLLQKSFWGKILGGHFDFWSAFSDLASKVRVSFSAPRVGRPRERPHYVARMVAGLERHNKPLLLLLSGRDLTAREFENYCAASTQWSDRLGRRDVERRDLRLADHTFSDSGSLKAAGRYIIDWLFKIM